MQEQLGQPGVHPLLASRWSPTTFDPSHAVAPGDVELLLEAARWAPSAGNSQPWAFIVGRRGDATHQHLVRHLAGSSSAWAPTASLLVADLSHRYVEDTDWDYSEFSLYDLGQAVAHTTLQAQALGLSVRQFRGLQPEGRNGRVRRPGSLGGHHDVGNRPSSPTWRAGAGTGGEPGRQRRAIQEIVGSAG